MDCRSWGSATTERLPPDLRLHGVQMMAAVAVVSRVEAMMAVVVHNSSLVPGQAGQPGKVRP